MGLANFFYGGRKLSRKLVVEINMFQLLVSVEKPRSSGVSLDPGVGLDTLVADKRLKIFLLRESRGKCRVIRFLLLILFRLLNLVILGRVI